MQNKKLFSDIAMGAFHQKKTRPHPPPQNTVAPLCASITYVRKGRPDGVQCSDGAVLTRDPQAKRFCGGGGRGGHGSGSTDTPVKPNGSGAAVCRAEQTRPPSSQGVAHPLSPALTASQTRLHNNCGPKKNIQSDGVATLRQGRRSAKEGCVASVRGLGEVCDDETPAAPTPPPLQNGGLYPKTPEPQNMPLRGVVLRSQKGQRVVLHAVGAALHGLMLMVLGGMPPILLERHPGTGRP